MEQWSFWLLMRACRVRWHMQAQAQERTRQALVGGFSLVVGLFSVFLFLLFLLFCCFVFVFLLFFFLLFLFFCCSFF